MDQTFVMVKPDGVKARLVGEIVSRFERRGFVVEMLEMKRLSRGAAEEFYEIHKEQPFFRDLIDFITSGPVVGFAVRGPAAVDTVRKMIGATDPGESAPGTIRGDFALEIDANVIHGSDSPENADRERRIFFSA